MATADNTVRNIVVGIILGPFAGAYFGYRYAQQKQELYALNPTAERGGWDSKLLNVLVGVVACGIAAPLFGYHVAKMDMKLDEMKAVAYQARFDAVRAAYGPARGLAPQQDVASNKWRDYVAASQQAEIGR